MSAPSPLERFEHKPMDFVGIAAPTLVYIGVKDRAAFDQIAAPCEDRGENEQGHVLVKRVGNFGAGEVTVIFQHWVKSLTIEAMYQDAEDAEAREAQRVVVVNDLDELEQLTGE